MRKLWALVFGVGLLAAGPLYSAEPWKGRPDSNTTTVGLTGGLGIIDPKVGFALQPSAGFRVLEQGFVPDVNNQVFFEVAAGPVFLSGGSAFSYSLHLRWDFKKDLDWTFFAIGGLGGHATGSALGDRFILHPRFGLGAFRWIDDHFAIRMEASHELISGGISYGF